MMDGIHDVSTPTRDASLEPQLDFGNVSHGPDWPGNSDMLSLTSSLLNFLRKSFPNEDICMEELLSMAKHSLALRYAMASFSNLLYSVKENLSPKWLTFLYYEMALHEFNLRLIDSKSIVEKESETALATALFLAWIEVSHFDQRS
jgi:hypothetical protein